MANRICYVDPAATGSNNGTSWANAYTTMNAWEQAEDNTGDLVGRGDTMTQYFRSSGVHPADTTPVSLAGWTTGIDNWIKILHGQWESPVDGNTEALGGASYNNSQYRLECSVGAFVLGEEYVTVRGLQTLSTGYTANCTVLTVTGIEASNSIELSHCFSKGDDNATYWVSPIHISDSDIVIKMYNCVGYNAKTNPGSSNYGIYFNCAAGSVVYNCTTYGGYIGIRIIIANSITAKNCLSWNTAVYDYYGTYNSASDYNVSEDATAPNGGGHSTINKADIGNYFDNEASGDFRLNASIGLGINLSAIFTDDIAKAARSAWDVGADEYVAAVSAGILKRYSGAAWGQKIIKEYSGAAWVEKPLKRWDGAAWQTVDTSP
jgi:hypothetical protein